MREEGKGTGETLFGHLARRLHLASRFTLSSRPPGVCPVKPLWLCKKHTRYRYNTLFGPVTVTVQYRLSCCGGGCFVDLVERGGTLSPCVYVGGVQDAQCCGPPALDYDVCG
jgi:hypothetical protein